MPLLTSLLIGLLALPTQAREPQSPDLIVHNARIWTADEQRPAAQWLAAGDGVILAMGDGEEWRQHQRSQTRLIDAAGRRVVPGFIDTHVHLANAASDMAALDLRAATSREELLDMLRRHAPTLPEGAWLVGTRWSSESWPDQRPPNADEIDEATDGRPAVLIRMDGHSLIASRSALEIAGIDRDGPSDPPGGTIGRDETGQPTGAVYEQAMDLVREHTVTPEIDFPELLARAIAEANRNGITSVGAIETRRAVAALSELDRGGKLTLRCFVSITDGGDAGDTAAEWVPVLRWADANRQPSPNVRILGIKAYMDGSLGSRTAWMTEPYEDNHLAEDKAPDNAGYPLAIAANEELPRLIELAAEMNLQPIVHAIGDRANHVLLNWYEQHLDDTARRQLRPRVEHVQHLLPADIPRFGELGVVASMQPYHKADDGRYAEQRLGDERIQSSYAFRSLLDSGAVLAFGSDWPVVSVSPFLGIDAAVNSRTLEGEIFVPEQAISVEEALIAYTRSAAYALHADRIGVLKPGHAADLVILDRDLIEADPAEIPNIRVDMTIVGGRVVFERGE